MLSTEAFCVSDHCFAASPKQMEWRDAATYCRQELGDGWTLACPRTSLENKIGTAVRTTYTDEMRRMPNSDELWLGYRREISAGDVLSCRSDGNEMGTYSNWDAGYGPRYWGERGGRGQYPAPDKSCVETKSKGMWATNDCRGVRHHALCHLAVGEGSHQGLLNVGDTRHDEDILKMCTFPYEDNGDDEGEVASLCDTLDGDDDDGSMMMIMMSIAAGGIVTLAVVVVYVVRTRHQQLQLQGALLPHGAAALAAGED